MPYRGQVKNGVVVLKGDAELPEGAEVIVALSPEDLHDLPSAKQSLAERLSSVIGQARDLPLDAARNHDHYLYGKPKK